MIDEQTRNVLLRSQRALREASEFIADPSWSGEGTIAAIERELVRSTTMISPIECVGCCGHIIRTGQLVATVNGYLACSEECALAGDLSWFWSDPSDGDLALVSGDRRFKPGTFEPLGAAA